MNKQVMIGVGVSLLVLAALIFMFTRSSLSGSDASAISKEMPKAREGSPTFAPDTPVVTGERNGKGHAASASDAPGGGAAAPPP
ncbi:MAG: hypothetical protein JWL77_5960 [Chthonomonadaceae bacterium]|nr:hypothetical protein [Chthonomonadaceae bacterium]